MKKHIICPECGLGFYRHTKHINACVRRSGVWMCRSCSQVRINTSRAKPDGSVRVVSASGYLEEKHAGKWVRQHRLVVSRAIGRPLMDTELVHHIDGDKQNNDLSNLAIETWGEHTTAHHSGSRRTGIALENIRRAVEHRTTTRLSPKIVEDVRRRAANGESQSSIAKELGVSPMTISRAVRGESWKNAKRE